MPHSGAWAQISRDVSHVLKLIRGKGPDPSRAPAADGTRPALGTRGDWLPQGAVRVSGPGTSPTAQLGRDVRMLLGALAGSPPRPSRTYGVGPRGAASAQDPGTVALATRTLRIERVVRETQDAVSLWLNDPAGSPLPYAPGQFLTVELTLNGAVERRAYSLSSHPSQGPSVRLTIKRVRGGRVSNALVDGAAAGQWLHVLGPSGSFGAGVSETDRHVLLVAGGSGITPMLAIAREVLANERGSHVTLVDGNRTPADTIFAEEIDHLCGAHADRFRARFVYEEPGPGGTARAGRLDRHQLAAVLDEQPAALAAMPVRALLCGPEPMMAEARACLLARGVPEDAIVEERFTAAHRNTAPGGQHAAHLRVQSTTGVHHAEIRAGATILEAAREAGIDLPFSCGMGGCGACRVRLVEGDVALDDGHCLSTGERAKGYTLTCVGRPGARGGTITLSTQTD